MLSLSELVCNRTLGTQEIEPSAEKESEMETGQWVMRHGSNGSPFLLGSRGVMGHCQ